MNLSLSPDGQDGRAGPSPPGFFFFFLNKNKIKSLVDEKQFDQSPPKIVGYFIDTFLIFGLAALRS